MKLIIYTFLLLACFQQYMCLQQSSIHLSPDQQQIYGNLFRNKQLLTVNPNDNGLADNDQENNNDHFDYNPKFAQQENFQSQYSSYDDNNNQDTYQQKPITMPRFQQSQSHQQSQNHQTQSPLNDPAFDTMQDVLADIQKNSRFVQAQTLEDMKYTGQLQTFEEKMNQKVERTFQQLQRESQQERMKENMGFEFNNRDAGNQLLNGLTDKHPEDFVQSQPRFLQKRRDFDSQNMSDGIYNPQYQE